MMSVMNALKDRDRILRREFSDSIDTSDFELDDFGQVQANDRYAGYNSTDDACHLRDEDSIFEEQSASKENTRCSNCMARFRKVMGFLLSHAGLVSLVVLYCLLGAVTFENLEKHYEIAVKKNVSRVRAEVSKDLWEMTEQSSVIIPSEWILNASARLQLFERELIRMMRTEGWDGVDSLETRQWTFTGALFYSIVVITTIGYGHITPKTHAGKIVTMFYAVLGIPMMLICLTHIGDFLATAFRVLYWKVCCYVCTRRPRIIISPSMMRVRSVRTPGRAVRMPNPYGRTALGRSRSLRVPSLSQELQASDTFATPYTKTRQFRRALSDEGIRNMVLPKSARERTISPSRFHTPNSFSRDTSPNIDPSRSKNMETSLTTGHNEQRKQEPRFGSSLGKMGLQNNLSDKAHGIYINKYALDVTPSQSCKSKYKFQRQMNHLQLQTSPRPEQVELDDYYGYEYEDDDYYWAEEQSEEIHKRPVPIWLCILLVVSYIIGGAFLFSNWEDWKFLDSAYFCFVTLTTIGFGDYVPAQKVKRDVELSIALCSLYLLFGISLLAMSFNLVQEQVIGSVKNVATKLGIIKEQINE